MTTTTKRKGATKAKGAKKSRKAAAPRKVAVKAARAPKAEKAPKKERAESKLTVIEGMLRANGGASVPEMMRATGWQAHSVRAALSANLSKKRGLTIESEKKDGVRVYRITGKAA